MAEEVAGETVVLRLFKPVFTEQTAEHADHILDQNTEQKFKAVAIRRLIWKLDLRLIPFLVLLQIGSFIVQASIGMYICMQWLLPINYTFAGHVKVMGIHVDMQMSLTEQEWFVSIYFLAYVRLGVFECRSIRMFFLWFSLSLEYLVISCYALLDLLGISH